jgi:putative peptidoglycan lipid II flippase
MSLGTVLSRVTGLLRITAIAAALGVLESKGLADTFNLANTAPNIIYELVLGGILTSVFVPVFVELLSKEGRDRAWEVASAIINLSLVVLVAITIIGLLAAPLITNLYSSGLDGSAAQIQQQKDALTLLLRLFVPQIIFYGLTAVTAGLLNAHKRFGAPMYTPILNNLAVICVFVAFHQAYPAVTTATVTTGQLWIIGLGTTAGVALMAFAQLPFLRGVARYRLSFSLAHPSVRKLARLSVFVIGYVVANQIGYLVVQWLAYHDNGDYSAYVYAFIFFMLPHGLFAVSIITALLPGMSEHASHGRWDEFVERLSTGIRTTALLIFPAAVGYFVLGEGIVRVLIQYGNMGSESTELVAGVLRFFVLGLLPFSLFQLFLRAFYALQDTKTPFLINCGCVALNTALNIPLYAWLGARGLALGHAIAYSFGVIVQGRVLARRLGGLDGVRVRRSLTRIFAAALVMGALLWLTWKGLETALDPVGFAPTLLTVIVPVGLGTVCYLTLAHVLGVEELGYARRLLLRRAKKSRPPESQPTL